MSTISRFAPNRSKTNMNWINNNAQRINTDPYILVECATNIDTTTKYATNVNRSNWVIQSQTIKNNIGGKTMFGSPTTVNHFGRTEGQSGGSKGTLKNSF